MNRKFGWLWKLTGGRPMIRLEFLFVDLMTGRRVYHYKDRLGRRWMATGSMARFRTHLPGFHHRTGC